MKYIFFVFTFLLLGSITAQPFETSMPGGSVSGVLFDKGTKKPLEFGTVALFRMRDSSVVSGMMTKADGVFKFTDLRPGMYYLRVEVVGYNKMFFPKIGVFPPDRLDQNIGKLDIEPNIKLLKAVEISGEKGFNASQIDKRIYSPSQLMSSVVGSAAELLNNIPSVNLNSEGQMNFRGNDNVTILIDGKPSSLTNNSLQQIPAQSIESVEVLTNPSAKYNPEGTAGIINIVMKKNKSKINSGSVTLGYGSNDKYNLSTAYNFQHNKWNLYLNYGYRNEERWSEGYTNRDFQSGTGTSTFYQDNKGNKFDINHFARTNIEYTIDDKQSFSIGGNVSMGFKNEYTTKANTSRIFTNELKDEWVRNIYENNNSISYDIIAAYKREYSNPRHYLSVDFTRNYNANDVNNKMDENYYKLNFNDVYTNTPFSIYNWQQRITNLLKIDYAKSLGKNYYIEAGFNGQMRDFNFTTDSKKYNSVFNEMRTDSTYSNDFRFLDDIYSVYSTLSGKFGKFSAKAGLRLEQTNTRSDNYNRENYYHFNYFAGFPSASVSYDLPKNQNISLSYSRRINRAGVGQLNPVQDIQDPTSIRLGNPYLRPEFINSLETGYGKSFGPIFGFSTNIYYKFSYDAMTRFVSADSQGRAIVQIQNLGQNINAGWEALFNAAPKKWLNLVFSSNLSKNELSYTTPTKVYVNGNWTWSGRLNATVKLPKEFDLQLVGFYRSPSKTPQGVFQYHSSVDFTIRKKLFKQRGLLTFNVSDIFNTMRFKIEVSDFNFNTDTYRKSETRIATISFRYNFGSEGKKSKLVKPIEMRPAQESMDL